MIEHSSGRGHGFLQIFNYIGIQREIIDKLFVLVFATKDQAQLITSIESCFLLLIEVKSFQRFKKYHVILRIDG